MYKLILKLLGWKIDENVPKEYKRCVLVGAPHTSNWDFFYSIFLFKILKIPYRFTIKSEWTRFPFNLIIKPLGGIPIDTKNKEKGGNVSHMSKFFRENKEFDSKNLRFPIDSNFKSKIDIEADYSSKTAKEKIEKAGGQITVKKQSK